MVVLWAHVICHNVSPLVGGWTMVRPNHPGQTSILEIF